MRYDDKRDFQGSQNFRGNRGRENRDYQGFSGGSQFDRYDRGYEDDRRFESYGDDDSSSFYGGRSGGGYGDEHESDRYSSSRYIEDRGFGRDMSARSRGMDDRYQQNREYHNRFGSGTDGFASRASGRQYFGRNDNSDQWRFSQGNDWGSGSFSDRGFSRDRSREGMGMWEQVKDFFGVGPKGYRRSDERIREEVSEVLARERTVDASNVEVDVKDGIVHLRGHVDSRWMKRQAEDCVEHLSGVRDVRNELEVRSEQSIGSGTTSGSSTGDQARSGMSSDKRKLA